MKVGDKVRVTDCNWKVWTNEGVVKKVGKRYVVVSFEDLRDHWFTTDCLTVIS